MVSHSLIRGLIICIISAFTIVCNSQGQAAAPLSAFNVDPNTVAVAGISSGGFMAVQLQVAYSKRIFGTAIFAGGPYYCAQDSSTTAQGSCESGKSIPLQALIDYTNSQASNGTIDPTSNIASKPIYMFSGVSNNVGSSTAASYTDAALSASTTYSYTVSALNSLGESAQSMAVSATTLGANQIPAAPNGLTVSGTTTSSVSLTWNASARAVAYNICRNGNKVGSSSSTSYIDSGLSGGTNYIFAVTAVNSSGESAKSQTVTAATQPQAVTAPVAQHYADGRLTLAQFLQLGQKYGYVTPITLYLCGSDWTNSSTCGPIG
jgi:poly(3-hydroxybutyrate) depolymerase